MESNSDNADNAEIQNDEKQKPEIIIEEFQIAADLTLYANPLRCLVKKSPSSQTLDNDGRQASEIESEKTGEMIAADLTKYGSPLDDKK